MTASNRQLLIAVLAHLFAFPAHAADVWFYEWRDPAQLSRPAHPRPGGEAKQHWVLTEFDGQPYASQLEAVRDARGFQKISLLFKFPPSAALADEYAGLAGALAGRGVSLQYKFEGSLPNASEAGFLKRACDAGASLVFISNGIPGPDEASALRTLAGCVTLDLALGRYPRYDEINALKGLEGVRLALFNDYFPQYAHMDILNILGLPVEVHVTDGTPGDADVVYLNGVKPLTGLSWEMKVMPDDATYAELGKLKRRDDHPKGATRNDDQASPKGAPRNDEGRRRLALRWTFSTPRDSDVAAWLRLQPERVQLDAASFEKFADRLLALRGEVLVETFPIAGASLDVMTRMAFVPQE